MKLLNSALKIAVGLVAGVALVLSCGDDGLRRIDAAVARARSHGQPGYRRGNEYISPDVDRHNGGIWKKATGDAANLRNKTTRDGIFNEDLTEMVGP
jgi:hypothetical protein